MSSRRNTTILSMSAIALNAGLFFVQPAQANDFSRLWDFFRIGNRAPQTELDRLNAKISNNLEVGRKDGHLTGREYRRLRRELDIIMSDQAQVAYGGFTRNEIQSLRNRLINLDYRTNAELRDGEIAGRVNRFWY